MILCVSFSNNRRGTIMIRTVTVGGIGDNGCDWAIIDDLKRLRNHFQNLIIIFFKKGQLNRRLFKTVADIITWK